jgi:hypothetical protein
MYLTHLEIRIWRGSFHTLKNGFFGLQNSVVQGKAQGKKTFFSTLNIMILQMVRNKCARFGQVDIEVSYKILQLDVLKETLSLHH